MRCPYCGAQKDRVVDSRESRDGKVIRRRRECLDCRHRFTTYERIDDVPRMVVKKEGRREPFDRSKILGGLLKSCQKRPVSMKQLEQIVQEVERQLLESQERELTSAEIGQHILRRLKRIDKIAYVRFASVYLDFKDIREFADEIDHLLRSR